MALASPSGAHGEGQGARGETGKNIYIFCFFKKIHFLSFFSLFAPASLSLLSSSPVPATVAGGGATAPEHPKPPKMKAF
jgi:hypothetical protein